MTPGKGNKMAILGEKTYGMSLDFYKEPNKMKELCDEMGKI